MPTCFVMLVLNSRSEIIMRKQTPELSCLHQAQAIKQIVLALNLMLNCHLMLFYRFLDWLHQVAVAQ